MKTALLTMALALTMFSGEGSSPAIISGIVTNSEGKPLTAVTVRIESEDFDTTVITNRYGAYSIQAPEGVYDIKFKYFYQLYHEIHKYEAKSAQNLTLNLSSSNLNKEQPNKGKGRSWVVIDGKDTLIGHSIELEDIGSSTAMSSSSGEDGLSDPLAPMEAKKPGLFKRAAMAVGSIASGIKGGGGEESHLSPTGIHSEGEIIKGGPAAESGRAGLLTSGEINDFRKWDMWNDIAGDELKKFRDEWAFNPEGRYTVQLVTKDEMPAIDYTVKLMNSAGSIIWEAKTDNTGKAELWSRIFDKDADQGGLSIEVSGKGKKIFIDNPKEFHNGINTKVLEEECSAPKEADILFAVDATGSMGDEIEYLKAELKDIIGKLGQKHTDLTLNVGSLFYRDVSDDYITKISDLNKDLNVTQKFIDEQSADGGGDFPEAVEMAMQEALNSISWSESAVARIMFMILDAPPHNTPEIRYKMKELAAKAALKGVHIIPVTCSGIDKSVEYLMRTLALASNGTYAFITNHSGIGGAHIEPTTDKYDVELLNSLFTRLIDQYLTIPSCEAKAIAGEEISDNIFNQDEKKIENEQEYKEKIENLVSGYPNPTDGMLTMNLSEDIEEAYLTDLGGKILARFDRIPKGSAQLNFSDKPVGIFFLKYRIGDAWGCYKVMRKA